MEQINGFIAKPSHLRGCDLISGWLGGTAGWSGRVERKGGARL